MDNFSSIKIAAHDIPTRIPFGWNISNKMASTGEHTEDGLLLPGFRDDSIPSESAVLSEFRDDSILAEDKLLSGSLETFFEQLSKKITRRIGYEIRIMDNTYQYHVHNMIESEIEQIAQFGLVLTKIQIVHVIERIAIYWNHNIDKLLEKLKLCEKYWNVIFDRDHLEIILNKTYNAKPILIFFADRYIELDPQYIRYAPRVSIDSIKYMIEQGLDIDELARVCVKYGDIKGFKYAMRKLHFFAENGIDITGLILDLKQNTKSTSGDFYDDDSWTD
jgi:hypothetical protein